MDIKLVWFLSHREPTRDLDRHPMQDCPCVNKPLCCSYQPSHAVRRYFTVGIHYSGIIK